MTFNAAQLGHYIIDSTTAHINTGRGSGMGKLSMRNGTSDWGYDEWSGYDIGQELIYDFYTCYIFEDPTHINSEQGSSHVGQ